MITNSIRAWTKPKQAGNYKKSFTFAVKFPGDGHGTGPLWITRPSLTSRSKKKEIVRITSVYPVVVATNVSRPRFQWTVEMATPGNIPWMALLPDGYLMTMKGGLRVLDALIKSNSLSYRSVEGSTSISKTGPDHVSYRLYNPKTGEEIISDIFQK